MAISNIYIDFEFLKTKNCKTLKVIDVSNWSISFMDAAYIEILTPGSTKEVVHILRKNLTNVFNANNLNLSDVTDYSELPSIPDGVYQVTIKRCEDDLKGVTKYFLQDCIIRCQVARKIMSIDLNCEPCRKDLIEEMQDITFFLDAAQAQVDQCNVNKAMEYYRRAVALLDRISDGNSNCNC